MYQWVNKLLRKREMSVSLSIQENTQDYYSRPKNINFLGAIFFYRFCAIKFLSGGTQDSKIRYESRYKFLGFQFLLSTGCYSLVSFADFSFSWPRCCDRPQESMIGSLRSRSLTVGGRSLPAMGITTWMGDCQYTGISNVVVEITTWWPVDI